MKKQSRVDFPQELKVDDFPPTRNVQQNETLERPDEETNTSDTEYTQGDETLDMAILQELIRDEEKTLDLLIKDNDRSVDYIVKGEMANALGILEKMEKLMEYLATNGRILDRNIIIVCLYNIAATFQGNWELAKCSKYLEAVTYNLAQSISHDESYTATMQQKGLEESQVLCLKAITLRKKQFLVKVYLQYCAVSSQLNKHDEALAVAQKAQSVMFSIISECYQFCKETIKDAELDAKAVQTPQKFTDRSRIATASATSVDLRKSLLNDITFKDEVFYNKQIIESALPFLEDFMKNTKEFSRGKMTEIINQTRNLLFNWKNNPENNEKYIRKELTKDKVSPKLAEENRTLLGVQQDPEWLSTLNIGSIMHIRPLKYKDYAQKREYINELTKTSLQEKSVFQSLTFFTLATEMRFMEMNKPSNETSGPLKEGSKSNTPFRASEAYHLKAIEIVCRYITGPCPYINHLITSYQKHYGQDLETIPEESVHSFTESTMSRDISKDEKLYNSKEDQENDPLLKLQLITKKNVKRFNTTRERGKGLGDGSGISGISNITAEEERYKEMRRDRKTEGFKSMNIRAKKLLNKGDEMKKVYNNSNISNSSPNKHSKTELSIVSPKLHKTTLRYDTEATSIEKLDEKFSSKKGLNVPSLGLKGVFLKDVASPNIKNKPNPNEGYQSERVIPDQNAKFNAQYNSTEAEKKSKVAVPGETNFYLYKNFNKFIQNFYVRSEQAMHQKAVEDKLKEKYQKHPYQKDTSDIKAKKIVPAKKSGSTTYSQPVQPKTPNYAKKSDLSPMARNHYSELFNKLEQKRPKTASKRAGMVEDTSANHSRGNSSTSFKLSERLVKSISTRDLDFMKTTNVGKK